MGILAKINPKKIGHIGLLFVAGAVAFSLTLFAINLIWPDKQTPAVLSTEQIRAITAPITAHQDSLYNRNEAARRLELNAAVQKVAGLDSTHKNFLTTQPLRDEKINRALNADDAELMQFFSDRYGR